jgi:hypothetical protein
MIRDQTVSGDEVQVGDIIQFFGEPHMISRVEPYTHPTVPSEGWRIGYDSNGWAITLIPSCCVYVIYRAKRAAA